MSEGASEKIMDTKADDVRGKTMFFFGVVGMLLFGWAVFPLLIYKSVDQPVQFSHRTHTGDNVALECEDCHNYDAEGRFCGVPPTAKCAECHTRQQGISKEETRFIAMYMTTGKEIPWIIYSRQPRNVYFSHAAHVKLAGLECRACHFGQGSSERLRPARFSRISGYGIDVFGKTLFNIPSTPSTGMRMDDCVSCHHDRGVVESCIGCHK